MPCFNQLPYVVLNQILRKTIDTRDPMLSNWAKRLPLLGVCRKWREIAVSLVYSNVVIVGHNKFNSARFFKHSDGTNTEHRLFNTNIGLVKSVGKTHLVKTVAIRISCPQFGNSLVNDTDAIFAFNQCDWSNVSKIALGGRLFENGINGFQPNHMQKAHRFVMQLTKYMPNVSALNFAVVDQFGIGSLIVKLMSEKFSRRLKVYANQFPFMLSDSLYFEKLTSLDIDVEMIETQFMPHICSQTLQTLVLRNTTSLFPWSRLTNAKQIHDIQFSQLHSLELDCIGSPAVENTEIQPMVCFPNLKCLDITVPTFDSLKHYFEPTRYQWHNVTKLNIDVVELSNEERKASFVFIQRNNNLAAAIKRHMPCITQMSLGNSLSDNKENIFYNALANIYAHQLVYANFTLPVAFTENHFSCKLTHLILNVGLGTLKSVPRLFAESLRHLTLTNTDPAFSWDMLISNPEVSQTINFEQLECINIEYNTDNDYIDLDWQQLTDIQQVHTQHDKLTVLCPRVKKIYIKNATVCRIRRIMCNGANQWNSMRDLVVRFKKFSEAEVDKVSDDNCMLATSRFSSHMVASIPNINKLDLDSYYSGCDTYTKRFCNIAFNSYAHQLKSYSSNVPVVLTAAAFPPELTKLRITIDSTNNSPLPKINASAITIISIKGCLDGLSWNSFASKDGSTNIEFSNLKTIVVKHTDKSTLPDLAGQNNSNTTIAEQAFQLHMPSLTFITLTDIDDDSKLLTASINFKHISRASITGSYKVLKLFKHSHEGKMSYCDVEVSVSPNDDINEFYELTNIVFGSTIKINRAALILNMDKSGWNIRPISWANLYDLDIKQSIQFDTLVELLPKMPRMNELTVNDILCDDLSYISIYRVKCISTSVTKLKLDFTSNDVSKGTMDAVVKYLILSMPSLKEMSWTGGHFDHVTFVEMYKSVYPHLASMRF